MENEIVRTLFLKGLVGAWGFEPQTPTVAMNVSACCLLLPASCFLLTLFSVQPLRPLCLCGEVFLIYFHHGGTEHTEVSQRKPKLRDTTSTERT